MSDGLKPRRRFALWKVLLIAIVVCALLAWILSR